LGTIQKSALLIVFLNNFMLRNLAFDFSTLPKIPTHTQLGWLGQEEYPCTWNPTTWPNCINVFVNARQELQDAYYKIIQMVNSYNVALQRIANSPDSPQKDEMIQLTQQRASEARQLLTEAVGVANAFEAEVDKWKSIPGFETVFLSGLSGIGRRGSLGQLGQLGQLIEAVGASVPLTIFYTLAGVVGFVSVAYIVGKVANTLMAHENEQIAAHNAWGKCMEAYNNAITAGQAPPSCGNQPGGLLGDISPTTVLIVAMAVVAIMFLRR
jgi:hypothetical protein